MTDSREHREQALGKKRDDTRNITDFRLGQLEDWRKDDLLRIQALELWRASVEEKVKNIKSGTDDDSRYAPSAKDWVKIILTALALLGALITYITQKAI